MILSPWILILVFYATDTVTIIETQKVSVESGYICLEAKKKIEKEYKNLNDLFLKASCLQVKEEKL